MGELAFLLPLCTGPCTWTACPVCCIRACPNHPTWPVSARPLLQGASLQALSSGGDGAGGLAASSAASAALERMGNDLFALVDGDSDSTADCARFVSFFSAAAASWQAAGQRERAHWCLERAMRYSQQLEAQVASGEVPLERKQGFVVALFNLYLEGAKSAAHNKQQERAHGGAGGRAGGRAGRAGQGRAGHAMLSS